MTRLPFDTWNITPRLDLPAYELNAACPVTGEVSGLEDHHIVRRSFTALGKEDNDRLFWIELPTGEIVGNRINLSSEAHYRVTVNKARIAYQEGEFWWVENDEWTLLRWQPPTWDIERETGEWVYSVANVGSAFQSPGVKIEEVAHLEPGHDCPTCKRRVPIPKKKSSPTDTKPMTFGRAPADAADELKDRVNDLAVSSGLSTAPYPQVRAIMLALLLAESVHPDLLQEVASDMTWGKKKDA